MKVTLRNIWAIGQSVEQKTNLAKASGTAPPMSSLAKLSAINLPVKVAYWLGKKIKAIDDEYGTIRQQWIALIKQYGKETSPDNYAVIPEREAEFYDAFNALLDESIEIPGPAIPFDALGEGSQLSGDDMILLDFLFDMGIEQDSIEVESPPKKKPRKLKLAQAG